MARLVTLIVEDGSIIPGANSFVSESQIVNHALARGVLIPALTDSELDAVAVLGIKAMDYLAMLPWIGSPVDIDQTTPWPRKDTGLDWPDNKIPPSVIQAQLQLAMFANAGVTLVPGGMTSGMVVREKVGPIEQQYSETVGVSSNGLPSFPGIDMLLNGWIIPDAAAGAVPLGLWSVGC